MKTRPKTRPKHFWIYKNPLF